MMKIFTTHWARFSNQQRLEIRNNILSFLASNGPGLPGFVVIALVNLLCRITKLGWFDTPEHCDIVKEVSQFLSASIDHCIIGLQIFNDLVAEMNVNKTGQSLSMHRKKSVSFRDRSLLHLFQLSLQTMSQLVSGAMGAISPPQDGRLREQALKLSLSCLSYDFIGTSIDESTEDVGTVQIPTSWRPIIEDESTLSVLMQAYSTSPPPLSAQAMECVSQLASVRRSLFPTVESRQNFLSRLIASVLAILRTRQGLSDEGNFHEFCRVLARIKSNFQLSEIIKFEGYSELISQIATFTVQSLRSGATVSNSVFYILQLWSRMVTSVAYLRGEGESMLERYVPEVTQTYIASKVTAARAALEANPQDDPMEDEEMLVDQLDSASPLCRYQYEGTAHFLLSLMDPAIAKLLALGGGGAQPPERVEVVEGELAWMIYIVGAVVGARGTSRSSDEHELLDGDLSARVFQTLQWLEMRQSLPGATASATLQRLELAVLYFFQYFRKAYVGEQANVGSTHIFTRLGERCGVGDLMTVLGVIMNKTMSNLKTWCRHEEIVEKSLALLNELASGYSSGKALLKLDVVLYALQHHGPQSFPFLAQSGNSRHRTTFYTTLTRILLTDDNGPLELDVYMAPFSPLVQNLSALLSNPMILSTPGAARDEAKMLLIGFLRDLRGVVLGIVNRRSYSMFFDWIYPDYLPLLGRAAEIWWNDSDVTTPLLKFMGELVHNKCQRILFECSSPNGILLFREASALLVAYGRRILSGAPNTYKDKYKGVAASLATLTRALGGGYVNFGVFGLYGDSALTDALDVVLQLSLSIPLTELMAYPKVMKAYFSFQEILCHNHTAYLCRLSSQAFFQIMGNIQHGLKCTNPPHDMTVSSECASALYHIVEFHFRPSKREAPAHAALEAHLQANPRLMGALLGLLMESVIYDECPNQWALSRPMLGLILTGPDAYEAIKQQMVEAAPAESKASMVGAFDRLMAGVQRNLESRNRDKFTQNLTTFRHEAKTLLSP